jgi:ParB family chromosome partitioning protein
MGKQILEFSLHTIHPNRRISYHKEIIDDICRSVRSGAQIEPIEIRFTGERYVIIDGEKRWRACKRLGMKRIKVILIES